MLGLLLVSLVMSPELPVWGVGEIYKGLNSPWEVGMCAKCPGKTTEVTTRQEEAPRGGSRMLEEGRPGRLDGRGLY